MRKYLLFLFTITLLASCSSPKYTYHFDYYDYNSGRKGPAVDKAVPVSEKNVDKNPLALDTRTFTASNDNTVIPLVDKNTSKATVAAGETSAVTAKVTAAESARRYKELSKTQRKEFRKAMRENMMRYVVPRKTGDVTAVAETKALDYDLKMAIIFGAVGLTLSLFSGVNTVFWVLSIIAVVVGLVFLIKWLSRQ